MRYGQENDHRDFAVILSKQKRGLTLFCFYLRLSFLYSDALSDALSGDWSGDGFGRLFARTPVQ